MIMYTYTRLSPKSFLAMSKFGYFDLRQERFAGFHVYLYTIGNVSNVTNGGQPEISNFDRLIILADKHIAGLQITMHYTSLMTVKDTLYDLPHNIFDLFDWYRSSSIIKKLF